ncbi:MAG: hypothetical protein HC851_21190 [Acaryochloris sp. RU_4_1]|nr:hypothetical protein [Acaryochloris sp. RU_4_1]
MLKTTHLLSLLSIAAISLVSFPARADQINTQVVNQEAAAVGTNNTIYQDANQTSVQQNQRYRVRSQSTTTQDNLQELQQSAGAVGEGNHIEQNTHQINVQQNVHRRHRNFMH